MITPQPFKMVLLVDLVGGAAGGDTVGYRSGGNGTGGQGNNGGGGSNAGDYGGNGGGAGGVGADGNVRGSQLGGDGGTDFNIPSLDQWN